MTPTVLAVVLAVLATVFGAVAGAALFAARFWREEAHEAIARCDELNDENRKLYHEFGLAIDWDKLAEAIPGRGPDAHD